MPPVDVTLEGALFCGRCQRYRLFRFLEDRPIERATSTRGPVLGNFYQCSVCRSVRQWGCSG